MHVSVLNVHQYNVSYLIIRMIRLSVVARYCLVQTYHDIGTPSSFLEHVYCANYEYFLSALGKSVGAVTAYDIP